VDEPVWLTRAIVEVLHGEQVREHGGHVGLRDEALLESALARPQQRSSYEDAVDLPALAAEYGFGLARNHAFLDGNKRIAFVTANVFLILNGFEIDAPEAVVVDVMLRGADGRMDQNVLADWIRGLIVPCDPS